MSKKCDYCVHRNTLECKKIPAPKDLICDDFKDYIFDDFMLDICTLFDKQQITIQKIIIEDILED